MARRKGLLDNYDRLCHSPLVRFERWGKLQSAIFRQPIQFQGQVPANNIPLPAFVRQMANTTIGGQPAVGAKVISFWQGFAEMSKTIGMFAGGALMNRCGRK